MGSVCGRGGGVAAAASWPAGCWLLLLRCWWALLLGPKRGRVDDINGCGSLSLAIVDPAYTRGAGRLASTTADVVSGAASLKGDGSRTRGRRPA